MNKFIQLSILLLFTLALVVGCGTSATTTPMPSSTPSTKPTTSAPTTVTPASMASINRIDFVYFHPKRRCALCLNIEVRTKAFLETAYKDQMESGKITFTSYELEDKNNADVLKKYGAISSQLFVNTIVKGKENIQHIEKIWLPSVYNDATSFDDFLTEIVTKSLEEIN